MDVFTFMKDSNVHMIKVAETLLNPFGDDDDDFDVFYLIDRNLQVGVSKLDKKLKVLI